MRQLLGKAELEAEITAAVAAHPDCAGVKLWGGVYRLQLKLPEGPSWEYVGRHKPAAGPDDGRRETAIRTIVADLQSRYDLADATMVAERAQVIALANQMAADSEERSNETRRVIERTNALIGEHPAKAPEQNST